MAAVVAAAAAASVRRRIAYLKEMTAKPLETNIDLALTYILIGDVDNSAVYIKTCMKLGSAIDSAIAVNAVPSSSSLPQLVFIVKEVYRRNTELLQPSLMLLMLPIKAACQIGWFQGEDKDHLLMMVKKVSDGFSCIDKMNIEPSYANSYVSNIISRFYPNMKVENILTSFGVKAGYGTLVADFVISLGTLSRKCQNLWLLVARVDNMETAACIESPPNVDFLINGTKVPKRTKSDMGTGPQLPSNVTKTITHGVNLLQVIGDFDGPYIIAVAFMNLISSPDPPQVKDYLHSISAVVDSGCDVAEMSSRISLDCPISRRRIKTPVKGHLCKHPQCFDYTYFMEINSKSPTWKCPLCNKPVCNLDIRIDQDFFKILNEVAEDVSDVIISADGSWMVAMAEKSQTTETNRDTMSQNNHVPNTAGNPMSVEAVDILPTALHTVDSPICLSAKRPSTLLQSNVTMPAVSPPQVLRNPHLQSQESCGTVLAPSFMQQHMNPINLTPAQFFYGLANPNHQSAESQGRTDQATQADLGTSTTLFMPVQPKTKATNSLHSTALPLGQHRRVVEQQHYTTPSEFNIHTTELAQCTTMFTPHTTSSPQSVDVAFEELRKGDEQRSYSTPGQSEPAPTVRPVLQTQLPEASGDAMPSGRMRGRLRGDQLEAARLQFLAAPRQPIRADKPWSRPAPTHPMSLLMQQPPTNSENV